MGNLTRLRSLFLDRNNLSGPIPEEMGKISLEYLKLTGNNFTCMPEGWETFEATDTGGLRTCTHYRDRPALIAFYNATGGANWTNKTNWLSDQSDWGMARRHGQCPRECHPAGPRRITT